MVGTMQKVHIYFNDYITITFWIILCFRNDVIDIKLRFWTDNILKVT